jgi:hypothetical protein
MSLINRFADVIITEAMPNSLRGRLIPEAGRLIREGERLVADRQP